ncbi:MAG TPA: MFS transporter [Mycobacteriales bacterium]|nr:MFS transporter [Mycobacteriales bacterium]
MNAPAVQRRTLRVLTASQILGGVGVASGIAVGGLLAADLHGSATAAGLAQACSTIGAALLALPLARLMSRRGRRPGLATGYALGLTGAVCVLVAAQAHALWLLLVGMLLFGGGTTSNQQARYAATDLAIPTRRGRTLAIVVWATTVGAVTGPNLADPGARLADAIGLRHLAGSFLFSLVAFGLAAGTLLLTLRPDPLLTARAVSPGSAAGPASRLPLGAALRLVTASPTGLLGLAAVVVSHTVMVGVMVMTPVHMGEHGATLRVVGLVIGVHILGMYAFSPAVGWLADRFGRVPVVLAGALILLTATGVAGTAPEQGSAQLGVGLFLLGTGWSCGLVAGSTLLTESVPAAARPGVQGSTDLLMGLVAGLGGLAAGPVVAGPGYPMLNLLAALVVLPLVVLALGLVRSGGAPTGSGGPAPAPGVVAGEVS